MCLKHSYHVDVSIRGEPQEVGYFMVELLSGQVVVGQLLSTLVIHLRRKEKKACDPQRYSVSTHGTLPEKVNKPHSSASTESLGVCHSDLYSIPRMDRLHKDIQMSYSWDIHLSHSTSERRLPSLLVKMGTCVC